MVLTIQSLPDCPQRESDKYQKFNLRKDNDRTHLTASKHDV